jgi:polysaccharide pyruvyl transferase WcaK-like protein
MKNVLLSTSTGWNAGDDWIRDGLLRALDLRNDLNLLYWNRGWGIEDAYANALNVNLPMADYVIMAGTPEWIDKNEALYRHCLHHDKPMALLGVGKTGGYIPARHTALMRRVAESGLVEVAIARDDIAASLLDDFGIEASVLCDPAVFMRPRGNFGGGKTFVLGYRGWGQTGPDVPYQPRAKGPAHRTDVLLADVWASEEGPKIATVHDNREMEAASGFFGRRNVVHNSDPWKLLDQYAGAREYFGCRIHGFVAALIHGAPAHLVYHTNKAVCAEVIIQRLGLEESAVVSYLTREDKPIARKPMAPINRELFQEALTREREEWRTVARTGSSLRTLMRNPEGVG